MQRALLLAGLLCVALPLHAEPPSEDVLRPDVPSSGRLYVEPHVGINYTMLDGNTVTRVMPMIEGPNTLFESGTGLAPLVGVTLGYMVNDRFGFRFDVAYDSRSAGNDGQTVDTCTLDDGSQQLETIEKDYTIGVDYISLGLMATAEFGNVFAFVGPSIGLPISSTVEETWRVSDPDSECRYFIQTEDETREVVATLSDDVKEATRVSLKLGIGMTIDIADRLQLVPSIAYDLGLTDLFIPGDLDGFDYLINREGSQSLDNFILIDFNEEIRMSSLQASLGIRIPL